ncbi:MAG: hypothetical protein E5Y52_22740, partial [Mesorhizobium sp.]
MSDITAGSAARDPYRVGRSGGHGHGGHGHGGHGHAGHGHGLLSATGHGQGGPASKFVTVAYGFWIFLLSD